MISDRQISRLFWAVKAGLVVLLVGAAARAVLTPFRLDTAFEPSTVAGNESSDRPVETTAGVDKPADYSAILAHDPFSGGSEPAYPDVPEEIGAMPSAEELGLRLVGVVAGGPRVSRAVIESDQAKSTRPYKIGDVVSSATIESIEPEEVILSHAGQRRVLVLRTTTTTDEQSSPPPEVYPAVAQAEQVTVQTETVPQPPARLGYVEDVFRNATIEPYVQKGRTEGLKITGLDQAPLAATFGLRNGDVVRAVNGQVLTSKQKAFQVLMKARSQSKLDLELVRNGKSKDLSFDL